MKIYCGERDERGEAFVRVIGDGDVYMLPLRLDLYNHSPDGFEWGYGGSGPAQLALAILADALRAPAVKKRFLMEDLSLPATIAVRLHQDFKRQVIAGLARDRRWTITEQSVQDFAARNFKMGVTDVNLEQ